MKKKSNIIEVNMEDEFEERQKRSLRKNSGRKRLADQKKSVAKDVHTNRKNKDGSPRKKRKDIGNTHKKRNLKQVIEYDKQHGTNQAVARTVKKLDSANITKPVLPEQLNESYFRKEYTDILNNLRDVGSRLKEQMDDREYVSSKEIYAMSTLYSQIRETIADLRSITDTSEQIAQMVTQILQPFHKSVGSSVVSLLIDIRQVLHRHQKAEIANKMEVEIDTAFRKEALKLQEYYDNSCEKVRNIMEINK